MAVLIGKTSSCSGNAGEVTVGYTPLCYLVLGALEILFCVCIAFAIYDRNFSTQPLFSNYSAYILPLYTSVMVFVTIIGTCIGLDEIVGVFPSSVQLYLAKWFMLRFVTESLSIFLIHVGIGVNAIRISALIGFFWTSANFLIVYISFLVFDIAIFTYTVEFVLALLIIYYLIIWVAPLKVISRRPAAIKYSLLNTFLLISEMVAVSIYLWDSEDESIQCATELVFSVDEFLQLLVILIAFVDDSFFWQGGVAAQVLQLTLSHTVSLFYQLGLYSNKFSNLNHPILGLWDTNVLPIDTFASSVADLQKRVVTVIPYGLLSVDTRYHRIIHHSFIPNTS